MIELALLAVIAVAAMTLMARARPPFTYTSYPSATNTSATNTPATNPSDTNTSEYPHVTPDRHPPPPKVSDGTCTRHSCGAQDPVSDPKYNMIEIIKQSVLLEEHLTLTHKRCKDCIAKHMLIIVAYAEESVTLACDKVHEYPLMLESVTFYKQIFQQWSTNQNDDDTMREVAGRLRGWRKQLMKFYVIDP